MPWQTDGSFLRVNPQFTGEDVWQKDQQASIKVIATRHDYHDEDLAQGIEGCLNLDGYNAMRADLDMGGFNIINVGQVEEEDMAINGTWTPSIVGTVPAAGTAGIWQRVGNVVTIFADIRWGAITGNDASDLIFEGFPFDIATDANGNGRMFVSQFMAWSNVNLSGSSQYPGPGEYVPELFTRSLSRYSNRQAKAYVYLAKNNPNPSLSNFLYITKIENIDPNGEVSFTWSYFTNEPFPTT